MNDQPQKILPTQTISIVVQNCRKLDRVCGLDAANGHMERTAPLTLALTREPAPDG